LWNWTSKIDFFEERAPREIATRMPSPPALLRERCDTEVPLFISETRPGECNSRISGAEGGMGQKTQSVELGVRIR
jgi:hypothetical protein